MADLCNGYGPEIQHVPNDTPVEKIIALLKRDGAVFINELIPPEDVDQACEDAKERIENDLDWEGEFFPKETRRAPSMVARSATYTKTQTMNPIFQAVCNHFLTTRSWNWWGDKWKESVSLPYMSSGVAICIGPGAKAQPMHRDDYINHNLHEEISVWDDERDARRESGLGLMVAGTKVTHENGGTRIIPRSHLWGDHRKNPPAPAECISAEMEKGDGLITLSSIYHGGGANSTTDQQRLVFFSFAVRGFLRQEENQFLAVPREVVKQYDESTQRFMGYSLSDPACGYVEEMDPLYTLYPEKYRNVRPVDF